MQYQLDSDILDDIGHIMQSDKIYNWIATQNE